MTDDGDQAADSRPANPEAVDMVWLVLQEKWLDQRVVLVVLPRHTFEHWLERVQACSCLTWGELRSSAAPEVYAEVCDLCGYGSFDAYTRYLAITGEAPLPGVYDLAAEHYDPNATPPDDDEPFDAQDDIGACADGDWPPAVAYLMNEQLPRDLLNRYAERSLTSYNGVFATIPAQHRDDVLRDLEARGHRLIEEPRLDQLVHPPFRW